MRIWFYGWLVAAVAIAVVSLVARDRASWPFAVGAGTAAAIEAIGLDPAIGWAAFAGVSFVVFAVANYRRHRARHLRRGLGRHGVGEHER